MNSEQLNEIKERIPKRDDIVDWDALRTMVLEDLPTLVAEVEYLHALLRQRDRQMEGERRGSQRAQAKVDQLQQENQSLKRSLQYIAVRRESNRDWTTAHNALAVYGRTKGAY